MLKYKKLIIHTDGGARNNPGPAGLGVVIQNADDKVIKEISEYIGEATNNQAEYKAVIRAMEEAQSLIKSEMTINSAQGGPVSDWELEFYLDSELVVEQLNRRYKVKNKDLAPLFVKIYNAAQKFKKVSFKHIPREQNKEADRLVNEAIDGRSE